MEIKNLKQDEIKREIDANQFIIVNIFADWCGPCRMFKPVLEEVNDKYKIVRVNIDENESFAREMGVNSVPTTFVYKDKKVIDTFVGYLPTEVLEARLKKLI